MLKQPILAILRGIKHEHIAQLYNSFTNSGIDSVEITMNTENAAGLISELKHISKGKLTVGAGTVLTRKELDAALKAGAEFIVTPVINIEVIKTCVDNKIPVFPGALTPTEVWQAWNLGAEMVKVFPAGVFGPKYIKELLGPLNKIKLMAVGGVNVATINEFFEMGASAVAIGGSVFSNQRLESNKYIDIESDLKSLIKAIPKK